MQPKVEELRQFVILFQCPLLFDPELRGSLILPLFKAVNSLGKDTKRLLASNLAGFSADRLLRLVQIFQQFITIQVRETMSDGWRAEREE